MITYEIFPEQPEAHIFKVKLSIESPSQEGERLFMPAWLPGSYLLRDFSKHIISLRAYKKHSPNVQLIMTKLDSHTFQCEPSDGPISIEYEVYAWDRSVRGAHFDLTHGFFNGSSMCLCPMVHAQSTMKLILNPPPRTYQNKSWQVATSMQALEVNEKGFGVYTAPNYEDLIDHPFEMGCFERVSFEINNIPHEIVMTGQHDGDIERLKHDVERICESYKRLFEGLPFDTYQFLLTVLEEGYGGLEHRNSSALMCQKKCLPPRGMQKVSKDYRVLLGLFSHEYFHAWFVKRIRPLEFCDVDLRKAQHTQQLWAFEGITSYYDDFMLLRSGCVQAKDYLEALAEAITRVCQSGGRFKQTIKESSFDAWTKFYQPNENAINSIVSYYMKGALCALLFDLHIRKASQSKTSLDDVLTTLWKKYGQKEQGLAPGIIENILVDYGTESIKPLIQKCLEFTEELPLESMLKDFGISILFDYPEPIKSVVGQEPVSLGLGFSGQELLTVTFIADNSPAQKAGLAAQDILLAFDGNRVTANNLYTILERKRPSDKMTVHVFREECLLEFELELQEAPKTQAKLVLMDILNESQKALRSAWLGV